MSCVYGYVTGGCAVVWCEEGCWVAERWACYQWMPLSESVYHLPLLCCITMRATWLLFSILQV